MDENMYAIRETLFVTVEPGSELVSFLSRVAEKRGIEYGAFNAIGALDHVKLSFFDRQTRQYIEIASLEPTQELISCAGAVTMEDGRPVVHAHAVVVDREGITRGGHLLEGNVLFAQVWLHHLEQVESE